MLPKIYHRVMNCLHLLRKFLKEEEIVRYANGWNPLSSKTQITNINDWHNKKREARKEEAPVASTSKPPANQTLQEGEKNNKTNLWKPYFSNYRIPRIKKDAMEDVCNIARALMEFKDKEEQRMTKPHFQKK
ncbi:hypothetical protein O181_119863 [Austropuccinia psidii MF-1]|uniref:Uncharacterized protein n=1 Tax=Austropuccinia psidii MF-1 TaxID=1389203 RepID=A0A9Q3KEZ4_9BASI|nr:hypothetical protein [Austropuccinia psidii MF-1]